MSVFEGAHSLRPVFALGNRALNGQERGNVEVARALRVAGARPIVATSAWWGHEAVEPLLDELGVGCCPIPYARHFTKRLPARAWPANLRQLARGSHAFGRLLREHKATHVHLANPHYALAVLPAVLRSGLPVVYRLGDKPTLHHPLYRVLWAMLTRRVQRFVCVSAFVRRRAVASGVPSEKLSVIYSHPPERPASRRALLLPPFGGRTFVYVGQIAPHKGVHLFVDAAVRLCRERDDVRFLIAGAVPSADAFGTGLVAGVLGEGLGERIRFLGYVEDVPGLLVASDVHVCPSVWAEPLSNTVVEAKRAGRPSVVFAVGGLPELVSDGRDGAVVEAPSADALLAALRAYAEMPADRLAQQQAAAAQSLRRRGITEEEFTKAWVRVYREAAEAGG